MCGGHLAIWIDRQLKIRNPFPRESELILGTSEKDMHEVWKVISAQRNTGSMKTLKNAILNKLISGISAI